MAMTRRLRVDPVACDGFGHCAELLPELMETDEWGYPVVMPHEDVPPALLDLAERAVKACPRKALFIERIERKGAHRTAARRRVKSSRPPRS